MSFAHPEAWPVAAALWLAAAGWLALGAHGGRRRLARLLGGAGRWTGRGDALLLLAAAALALAWLGPQWGRRTVRIPATGIDLVVLLDVSRSMEATDTPPSRLERARATARSALASLGAGDRAALAVFAGHGALLTPLTPDVRALGELLPALDTGLMSDGASRLGAGVAAARGAFDEGSARPRRLLVLSDGEGTGDAEPDAAALRRAAVQVVAVAFGSEGGATLPDAGGVLRDALGRDVVTRRETAPLARLAEATDGRLLPADRWGEVADGALAAALRRGAVPTADGWIEQRLPRTHTRLLAALALALLLFEAAAPRLPTRGRRRAPGAATAALAGVAAVALAASALRAEPLSELEASVRARPEDSGPLLRLGVARARAGHLAEARRAFLAAAARARDPELAALAYYDLGVTALEARAFEPARDAFFDALALDPSLREAKFNLEWTLRALDAAPPPPPAGAGEPDPDESREPPSNEPDPRAEPRGAEAERETPARRTEPSDAREEPAAPTRPALDAAEVERWLDAVEDDAGRALRDAARRAAPERRERSRGPRW